MKIIFSDKKKGVKKIRLDSLEDLWHISNIIRKGDIIEGKTFRAVKFGNKEERKPVYIAIEAENIEFSKLKKTLRIGGKIIRGNPEEFVQKGRYHTLEFKENDTITITKEWLRFEEERIKQAVEESKKTRAYIVLVEENKVLVAKVFSYGIEVDEIEVFKSKKEGKELGEEDLSFLEKLDKELIVIVAGPGFAKNKVGEYLKNRGYRVVIEQASYAEISGIVELVENGVVGRILEEHSLERESKLMGEFEKHLFKEDGLACYGKENIRKAVDIGAVEKILVVDEYITDESYRELAKKAEKMKGKVYVFSSQSPWGKKLKGYGGIVAILRFPIEG